MRAVIKTAPGPGHLALLEIARPEPGTGEALVEIRHSGLCGTDLLVYDGLYRGRGRPLLSPLILGHEAAGVVVALGAGVSSPVPGTRVTIEAIAGCGHCALCRSGHYNVCQDWHHLGLTRHGALAEFVVVPTSCLWPVPDSVTFESAALVEPLATAVHTLERAQPAQETTAAIVGPGPLGLLHLQALQASGLTSVVVYGQAGDEHRLALAKVLGAEVFEGDRPAVAAHAAERTGGVGYGLSIEAGGSVSAIQSALDIVAGQGTLVSLGVIRAAEIDVLQVMRKNLTWLGVIAGVGRHFAAAIALLAEGRVKADALVTHRLQLDQILDGFACMRNREAVKVMFAVSEDLRPVEVAE